MNEVVVDTGVFSASLAIRRRPQMRRHVDYLVGRPILLATQTVAELRYGVLVAGWGEARQLRLEAAIAATTVLTVTDALIDEVAQLRFDCRRIGHPLAQDSHVADLWIAATARHFGVLLVTADAVFQTTPGLNVYPT